MPDDPRTTEALSQPPPTRATVRECRLTRLDHGRDDEPFLFAAERMVIGADPTADLVIADPAMSKFHCEIRISDGAAVVRDLGSRNGTRVDRVPILEAPLRDGAVLALGRTELRFISAPARSRSRCRRASGSAAWSAARCRCARCS